MEKLPLVKDFLKITEKLKAEKEANRRLKERIQKLKLKIFKLENRLDEETEALRQLREVANKLRPGARFVLRSSLEALTSIMVMLRDPNWKPSENTKEAFFQVYEELREDARIIGNWNCVTSAEVETGEFE